MPPVHGCPGVFVRVISDKKSPPFSRACALRPRAARCHAPKCLSYRIYPNELSELCSFDEPNDSFQSYAVSIEELKSLGKRSLCLPLGKNHWNMTHRTHDPAHKLRKAPQPPLPHLGAPPDSDRAKKPRLAAPSTTDQELNPGDRVEGLGDFGKPTGEFGTVEQTNEEDAVVKWDDDGRKRLHQPWLKKV